MRRLMIIAATCLFGLIGSGAAQAGIPAGYNESGSFIMELPKEAQAALGEGASLCHLVRKYHVAYIPLFYRSQGYAIEEARCTADSYVPVNAERLAALQAMGILPSGLPSAPSLTLSQKSAPVFWLLLAAAAVLSYRRAAGRQQKRFAVMGDLSIRAKRVLDTLAHAAVIGGLDAPRAADFVSRIGGNMTGEPMPPTMVAQVLTASQEKLKQNEFPHFVKGLTADQRDALMQAVLVLLTLTGPPSKAGQSFINGLANASKMNKKRMNAIVAKVAAPA